MQNRWFHPPHLHSPKAGQERKVGWLELFYDLIYVAAIIQLGNALSAHVGWLGFLGFAGLFFPLWLSWTTFTFFSNRFVVDDFVHRAMVFMQMFGVAGMAISIPEVLNNNPQAFALSYAAVRFVQICIYGRAWKQTNAGGMLARRYTLILGLGLPIWVISAFVATPWVYLLWALTLVADMSLPWSRASRVLEERYPADAPHLSERYGLLTIIVLGESFVKVLSEVAEKGMGFEPLFMGSLALLITFSLWWVYFDDVAGARIRRGNLAPFVWIFAHLPMTIGITAVGVAIKKMVFLDPTEPALGKYRWLLAGTLALALLSVGIIDSVTSRRQSEMSDRTRTYIRLASAGVVLVVAFVGAGMPAWVFVGMITAICLAQVIFDISMAPLFADPEAHHHEDSALFGDRKAQIEEEEAAKNAKPRRADTIGDAVRTGVPNELRRDFYFHFMQGSWLRLVMTLVLAFIITNLVFAALYLLDPSSVTGIEHNSFIDAFAFSVQTIATIGYGTLSPVGTYAHLLVTVQSFMGVIGLAVVTGLVFAKASRPQASILFSEPAVVTEFDEHPVLMFRLANARGNDIVEASVKVSFLMDQVTKEGEKLRRVVDMKLRRSMQPIFALSWTVFHDIDEESPFHGLTAENIEQSMVLMVVSMTGHDSIYAQTTHSRHMYYPEDIRFGHRFVDVISPMEDGRILIDLAKFHETDLDGITPPESCSPLDFSPKNKIVL
jgi:low temperature requirement protein LtrA